MDICDQKEAGVVAANKDTPLQSPDYGEGECDAGLYADDYEMTSGLFEMG